MQDKNQAAQELDHEFSTPWEQSDVVLLVEGQKFHVHRLILSMSSPVFSRMFSSGFKEKDADEIPLPGKKAEEIREMLLVMYPSFCKPLNETNVHCLLPLAREYQMIALTRKCEDYLLHVIEKEENIGPLLENLIIAQNYTLERVKTEAVCKTETLMRNMEKKLRDSQAENSKLRDVLKRMKRSASGGLKHFDSVVFTISDHIRRARNLSWEFTLTTDQHLKVIYNETNNANPPENACSGFSDPGIYSALQNLHKNLKELDTGDEDRSVCRVN